MFQTCDHDDEDVEIAVDNPAFMDDFFSQACPSLCVCENTFDVLYSECVPLWCLCILSDLYCLFQIEDIRNSIDKIDENVAEVKKIYSVILSAPTSDQSKRRSHVHSMWAFWPSSALFSTVW